MSQVKSQALPVGNFIDLEKAGQIGTVTAGTEYYEEFLIDNVLTFKAGAAYGSVEELYTAALHASSQWDGDLGSVAGENTPVYFADRGVSDQHGGGGLFSEDEEIMGWLFGEH